MPVIVMVKGQRKRRLVMQENRFRLRPIFDSGFG